MRIAAVFTVFTLLAAAGLSASGGLVEPRGAGEIDWSGGFVEAAGRAVPPAEATNPAQVRLMAERAAKVDAQRNLVETLKGVRVASETTVRDFMQASDRIQTSVNGVVKGAVALETKFEEDGSVTVRLRAPLWGNLSESVYDYLVRNPLPRKAYPRREGFPSLRGLIRHALLNFWRPLTAHADVPAAKPPAPPPVLPGSKTGIVLDFTDIQLKPEMYPTISDDKGATIVQPKLMDRAVAIQQGPVAYARSVEEARTVGRSGEDPLVLKALNFVAGTEAGIKVQFADGMGVETAKKALKDPSQVFKDGVTVAYRVTW